MWTPPSGSRVELDADADVGALVLRRATLHRRIGNVDAARDDAERALAAARETAAIGHWSWRRSRSSASILAGAVDYRAATPLFDEALHLAELLGDPTGLVSCHARLSLAWTNRLRFDRGLDHGERALAIAKKDRSPELEAVALDALKQVELQTGDFASAERHARALLPLAERRGDLWSAQFCHLELGMIKVGKGRGTRPRRISRDGLAVNRRVHDDGNTPAHWGVWRGWSARGADTELPWRWGGGPGRRRSSKATLNGPRGPRSTSARSSWTSGRTEEASDILDAGRRSGRAL